VPIKDLTDVAGVLTTQGSPIYKDQIAAETPTFWSSAWKRMAV
jgi:Asp-tRNA(Asn)/Glu-tRNA(Gln) amidotransferase A subunit family amidase